MPTTPRRARTCDASLPMRSSSVRRPGSGTPFDPEFVDLFLFPPIFERVLNAEREVVEWSPPVQKRRGGRDDENVPDITFRWRPGRNGSRGRPASDPTRQTAH